ncbi:MAG: hypothetical protein QOG53_1253 [Frankiales bacterium]|jgi:hypothetical protein|nr:hypothetical protein [Frankiales bacterium]
MTHQSRRTKQNTVTVVLRDAPIEVLTRANEHQAELIREFTLLAMGAVTEQSGSQVPPGLDALIHELEARDPDAETVARQQQDAAVARGASSVTLTMQVPPSAAKAALRLRDALKRADEFCRSGELLTLAPRHDIIALREWYLEEFDRQIAGESPLSWPEYLTKHSTG